MTKTARKKRCQEILHRGNPVSAEDQRHLIGEFENHPHRDEKFGAGIVGIEIGRHASGWPGFFVRRVDGTREEISFNKCIDSKSRSASVKRAFRAAVRDQVRDFKNAAFRNREKVTCSLTGKPLTWDQAAADHGVIPQDFESLFRRFVETEGIDINGVELTTGSSDGDRYRDTTVTDDGLRTKWQDFHLREAVLMIVCKTENLRQGRGR